MRIVNILLIAFSIVGFVPQSGAANLLPSDILSPAERAESMAKTISDNPQIMYFMGLPMRPYHKPGADPCTIKGGCTLEWAIGKVNTVMKWPKNVTDALYQLATTTPGERGLLKDGEEFSMVGGGGCIDRRADPDTCAARTTPTFSPRMQSMYMADVDGKYSRTPDHVEPYEFWFVKTLKGSIVDALESKYDAVWMLGRVGICQNWFFDIMEGFVVRAGGHNGPKGGAPLSLLPTGSCEPYTE